MYNKFEQEIIKYKIAYYQGNPIIPDQEYDKLIDQLPESSPVKHLTGYPIQDRSKIKHHRPMGSLKKIKTSEELTKWLQTRKDHTIIEMPKLDGSSIETIWQSGELIQAITRGDGKEGLDCTLKLKHNSIYKRSKPKTLRCEAILTYQAWKDLQTKFPNRFNQIRNAVAGMLNGTYQSEDQILYNYITLIPHWDNILQQQGKLICSQIDVTQPVDSLFQILENKYKNYQETFPVDGIVLIDTSEPVTYDKHMYPENQIAVKFASEEVEVIVTNITADVSRHGMLTPVIQYEPIELDGAILQRATAHNFEYIISHKIGKGSIITIIRSGGVIPYITGVVKSSPFPDIPEICPTCASNLKIKGVHLVCENNECPERIIKQLTWFFVALGIEGYSEKTFRELYELGFRTPVEYFDTERLKEILYKTDGWADKKINGLISQIDRIREDELSEITFMNAIGVQGIGASIWETILDKCSIYDWIDVMLLNEGVALNRLIEIEGISELRAQVIIDGIKQNGNLIHSLFKIVGKLKRKEVKVAGSNILGGKIFCITKKTELKREELISIIEKNGGKYSNSKFEYLITNFPDDLTGKRKKADQMGAGILSESEFFELLKV